MNIFMREWWEILGKVRFLELKGGCPFSRKGYIFQNRKFVRRNYAKNLKESDTCFLTKSSLTPPKRVFHNFICIILGKIMYCPFFEN